MGTLSVLTKAILDKENRKKIFEGIKTHVKNEFNLLPEDEVEVITERRTLCSGCPFNSENAQTSEEYFSLYGEHFKKDKARPDLHCSICFCDIDWKTASMTSDCGLAYWNQEHPNNKQDLKWKAYVSPVATKK